MYCSIPQKTLCITDPRNSKNDIWAEFQPYSWGNKEHSLAKAHVSLRVLDLLSAWILASRIYLPDKVCKLYSYQFKLMYSCQQVGNIFFLDKFLGHTFLKYGTKVLGFASNDQANRTDPMIAVFPRMTKCLFHTYGPTGMYWSP